MIVIPPSLFCGGPTFSTSSFSGGDLKFLQLVFITLALVVVSLFTYVIDSDYNLGIIKPRVQVGQEWTYYYQPLDPYKLPTIIEYKVLSIRKGYVRYVSTSSIKNTDNYALYSSVSKLRHFTSCSTLNYTGAKGEKSYLDYIITSFNSVYSFFSNLRKESTSWVVVHR